MKFLSSSFKKLFCCILSCVLIIILIKSDKLNIHFSLKKSIFATFNILLSKWLLLMYIVYTECTYIHKICIEKKIIGSTLIGQHCGNLSTQYVTKVHARSFRLISAACFRSLTPNSKKVFINYILLQDVYKTIVPMYQSCLSKQQPKYNIFRFRFQTPVYLRATTSYVPTTYMY